MNIIVSFSSRTDGNCGNIAYFLAKILPESSVYTFSDFQIKPCGGCDYPCFQNREACPYFDDMEYKILDSICHSDAAYYVVPNYCDYPCANFFIFNERSQCYFQGHPELLETYLTVPKKFIVVSNSCSDNFRQAFVQHTNWEPNILFLSAKSYGKNSISSDLITSESISTILETFTQRDLAK